MAIVNENIPEIEVRLFCIVTVFHSPKTMSLNLIRILFTQELQELSGRQEAGMLDV